MSRPAGRAAVFLDRDGVINPMWYDTDHGLVDSPCNPEQFSLNPGVAEAIRTINELGLLAVVVSNQPIVAKGKSNLVLLEAITEKMCAQLAAAGARLDAVRYCLHHPEAVLPAYRQDCDCRKPRPGLLLRAAADLGIDLSRSYMVGDGLTDVQAGAAAGVTTIWIGTLKCDICRLMHEHGARPDEIASDLRAAVGLIAARPAAGRPRSSWAS